MEICSKIAGFTLKEADDIRRAMGKKKKSVLDEYEPLFISGAAKQGITEIDAKELWDDLVGFADYCLHGNTRIFTEEYGLIAISKIVENNLPLTVFSLNKNGKIIKQKVSQFWNKGYKQCFTYTLENNTKIACTLDHEFLILNKNKKLQKENID